MSDTTPPSQGDPPLPPPPDLPPPPGLLEIPGAYGSPAGLSLRGPGPVRLQPMQVGETLDAAIRLYRVRWKTLMAIVASVTVPFTVIQTYAIHSVQDPFVFNGETYIRESGTGVTLVFFALNLLLIEPILRGAIVRAVAGIYLGETPTAGQSLRFALRKSWPLIVGIILADLLVLVGLVALVIPGVILWIRYQFVVEAVIVEDLGGPASIGRAWRLSRGMWWRIFGTLFLAGVITSIVSVILVIPGAVLAVNGGTGTLSWVTQAAFSALAQVITTPFTATVGVLLYFDARIRKEAFDLAVMAREVGSTLP